MAEEGLSFEGDQKFVGKLFLKYVAENEDFHERLEELELSWADDFHISNSMIQKTIGFMKQNQPSHTLIKMLKDEEDKPLDAHNPNVRRNPMMTDADMALKVYRDWETDRKSVV